MNAVEKRAEQLAKKIDTISAKFGIEEIDSSELVDYVQDKTHDIELVTETSDADEFLQTLKEDLDYSRTALKEVMDNSRRVYQILTMNALDADLDSQAEMILSMAAMSTSITNAEKAFTAAKKEYSNTLLNLKKLGEGEVKAGNNVTNNVTINTNEVISTVDLIAKLKGD